MQSAAQPFPQDDQPPMSSNPVTPYKKAQASKQKVQQQPSTQTLQSQRGVKKQVSNNTLMTESPLKTRPKTARQIKEDQIQAQKDLVASKASEKHQFSDKDAEIEHLRSELEIYKQRAEVVEDMENQNAMLQAQIDASYRTNAQQLVVNLQQADLIIAQASQIQALQQEKGLLTEQVMEQDRMRSQHQEMMTQSVQYMDELENRVFETNQVSLQLLSQIRDQTDEVETLKVYCMDLKSKVSVYIPIKEDPVDCRLADFVNNYPDRNKLKVMFLRESAGVYEFGTKRIEVKVAQGKINIRVGGGYMGIDTFLDQYTPIELEKLERRDPLRKFAEKLAIAKSVTQTQRDISPLAGN